LPTFRPPPVTFTMTSGVLRTVRRICSIWPIFSLVDARGPGLAWLAMSNGAGASEGNRRGRLLIAALPSDQRGFCEVVCLLLKGCEDDPEVSDVPLTAADSPFSWWGAPSDREVPVDFGHLGSQGFNQFSTVRPGTRRNSRSLFVTTVAEMWRACDAISMS
jgi:hypothetical protein